ncbi:hypothetical protein Vafri_3762 [Volvox africanus]|uniref:Uncharacterized protein n=1 Tax=Volvox africanus TaxID=51714 RepID=A0A8J4AWY5_9CHLO|nr:hypothetical protein Vafri_3762 [Volvox africanus]
MRISSSRYVVHHSLRLRSTSGTGTATSGSSSSTGSPHRSTGRTENESNSAAAHSPPPLSTQRPRTHTRQLPRGPNRNTALFSVRIVAGAAAPPPAAGAAGTACFSRARRCTT